MTATSSVASSRPMFNSFGKPAQNAAATAPNPFAVKPNPPSQANPFGQVALGGFPTTRTVASSNPFSDGIDSGSTPKASNPFATGFATKGDNTSDLKLGNPFALNPGTPSDGQTNKQTPGLLPTSMPPPAATKLPNGRNGFLKPPPQDSRQTDRKAKGTGSRQSSPSNASNASSGDEADTHNPPRSNDPHAQKVYEQLRKDHINPPQWPSQPGQPKNKVAMAKFRDSYEAYRTQVRASLTKAGLIDDPDKRKTLKDAIAFKGICEDMCPEFEKITRITEFDVNQPEKNPRNNTPNTRHMVKKLARSAAGQEAPLPMDVRSVRALKRTLDYLVDVLLKSDDKLPLVHGFLWDRTRAIRRDFTFFSSLNADELKTQVYVLENIARFHVTSLHLLSQEGKGPEDFVEQQELEQLGKALLSLRDVYDDCNEQGIICENEAEFRAYYLVFHANDPNIMEILQRQWSPKMWRDSNDVRTAISLVEAMQSTQDFHGPLTVAPSMAAASAFQSYFRIVEDAKVSYTMACFAECHFPRVRRGILAAVKRALARPQGSAKDVTAGELNKFLRFDTVQEAISFAELHDLEFAPDPEAPSELSRQFLVLTRGPISHPRLQHQFSQTLVERKRGSRTLPTLIHQTIFEDSSSNPNGSHKLGEESLFVQQEGTTGSFPQAAPTNQASWGKFTQPNSSVTPDAKPAFSPFATSFAPSRPAPATTALEDTRPAPAPVFKDPFAPSTQSRNQPVAFQSKVQPPSTFAPAPRAGDDQNAATKPSSSQPALDGVAKPSFSLGGFPAGGPILDPLSKTSAFPAATPFLKPSLPKPQTPSPAEAEESPGSGLTTLAPPSNTFAPSSSFTAATSSAAPLSMFPKPSRAVPGSDKAPSSFSTLIPELPTAAPIEAPKLSFPPSSRVPAALSNPALAPSALPKPSGSSLNTSLPSFTPPPKSPSPPKDLMGNFTKWFVQGDKGLLSDFEIYMVENMLGTLYDDFVKKEEETRRKEEEDRDNAKADKFRAYNLSLRMFYRWRERAREKRLKELRRQGREQARAFYEAQRLAELKARQEANRRSEEAKAHRAKSDHPQELLSMLKTKKISRREAEEALLASGVLSGVANERDAIRDIVSKEYGLSAGLATTSGRATRSPSVSSSVRGEGSKTRAMRESLLGGSNAGFRRSLPSMSSRDGSSPETVNRTSKVSERWRLKAMGLVTMPDGTAVPESLAREAAYKGSRLSGPRPVSQGDLARRASITNGPLRESRMLSRSHGSNSRDEPAGAMSPNKRKRPSDDDGATARKGDDGEGPHKRVMSDAEKLVSELRAMRQEMEEGATWFKTQNDRFQSEAMSRGSTPWEGSI